jgi:hypothetical protein
VPAVTSTTVQLATSGPGASTTTVLAGNVPNQTLRPAQPVAVGSLEADAVAAFGDRYAGVSYAQSGPDPRPATVHVKAGGTTLPTTFEGAAVVPAGYSLIELQQFRAMIDADQEALKQHGVELIGWGVDVESNAVGVFVAVLDDQVRSSFATVVGPGSYLLSQHGAPVAP